MTVAAAPSLRMLSRCTPAPTAGRPPLSADIRSPGRSSSLLGLASSDTPSQGCHEDVMVLRMCMRCCPVELYEAFSSYFHDVRPRRFPLDLLSYRLAQRKVSTVSRTRERLLGQL